MYSCGHADSRAPGLSLRPLHLAPVLHRLTRTLSTGWRQRLALATAIAPSAPAGLPRRADQRRGPRDAAAVLGRHLDLAHDGTTVFVTTHVMDEAEHCTHLAMMHYGKLIAQGTPAEMRRDLVRNMVEVQTERVWDALQPCNRCRRWPRSRCSARHSTWRSRPKSNARGTRAREPAAGRAARAVGGAHHAHDGGCLRVARAAFRAARDGGGDA